MSDTLEHAAATYAAFFEGLSDESVDDLRQLASPQMRYRDPLTDRHGIDAVTDYMHTWFQTMDDLSFDVDLHAAHGNVLLSHWTMNFRIRRMPKRPRTIEGMSKISLNAEGKVTEHVDYWDATPLLQAVPLLGRVVTLTRRVVTQSHQVGKTLKAALVAEGFDRDPSRFGSLAPMLVTDFSDRSRRAMRSYGLSGREARDLATGFLAQVRGLQLDLAGTGDQRRVGRDEALHRNVTLRTGAKSEVVVME